MSIIEKNKFDLAKRDLSPITINIEKLKDNSNQIDYYKQQLNELESVKEKNIKLAKKYTIIKQKYTQLKKEYNKTTKDMIHYHKKYQLLNINLQCPFLNKEIDIIQCNEACKNSYCDNRYNCTIRRKAIIDFYQITL